MSVAIPRDILHEILGHYFDRRVMETRLKLVSRRFRDIISTRRRAPYLVVERVRYTFHEPMRFFYRGKKARCHPQFLSQRFPDYLCVRCLVVNSKSYCSGSGLSLGVDCMTRDLQILTKIQKTRENYECDQTNITICTIHDYNTTDALLNGILTSRSIAFRWNYNWDPERNVNSILRLPAIRQCAYLTIDCMSVHQVIEPSEILAWTHDGVAFIAPYFHAPGEYLGDSRCVGQWTHRFLFLIPPLDETSELGNRLKTQIVEAFKLDSIERQFEVEVFLPQQEPSKPILIEYESKTTHDRLIFERNSNCFNFKRIKREV